jgi:hypothetical protein
LPAFKLDRQRLFKQPDQPDRPTRPQVIIWVASLITFLAIAIINFPKYQVGVTIDDAMYIVLAKSLISAKDYGLINFPGVPVATSYPFGFPLILAPLVAFFPTQFAVYKLLSLAAILLNASLLFWGWPRLTRNLSFWWGLMVNALYLFSLTTVDLSGRVMSEPVFQTFYLLAILAAERVVFSQKTRWWSFLLGIFLIFIISIRIIGIFFVFGIIMYIIIVTGKRFINKFWPALAGAMLVLTLVILGTPVKAADLLPIGYLDDRQAYIVLQVVSAIYPDWENNSTLGTSSQASVNIEKNMSGNNLKWGRYFNDYVIEGIKQHLGADVRTAISPFPGATRERAFVKQIGMPWLSGLIGSIFSGVMIFGLIQWFKLEKITAFNLTSVIYFASLFLWVWDGSRFLFPILPQLFIGFLLGGYGLLQVLNKLFNKTKIISINQFIPIFFYILVIAYAVLFIYKDVIISDSRQHVGIITDRTDWVITNTPESSVLMTEYPLPDYLYSGRKTVRFPYPEKTVNEICLYLRDNNVTYALIAPKLTWMKPFYIPEYSADTLDLLPKLEELTLHGKLDLVHQSDADPIRVYRVSQDLNCLG